MSTTSTSWAPVDLGPLLAGIAAGEITGPIPELLPRTDGRCLLYPGELHSLAGEPEGGKSWIALAEAARILQASQRALWIDFEDAPLNVISRLLALGVDADTIVARFVYVRPEEAMPPHALSALLAAGAFPYAVLDGVSEAYALLGLDVHSNADVPVFLRTLARPIAASGAAVVLIDHVVKDREARGRYALGAQHKLAAVAVAYGVEVIEPPSRTRAGSLKLLIRKDRHGHVRGHAADSVVALIHITPADDRVTVTIDPPDSAGAQGEFRPSVLMERASRLIEEQPGITTRAIRDGVKGSKTDAKDLALAILVREGYVDVQQDGRARRHHSTRPYRRDEDEQTQRAHVPDRAPNVPGTSERERAHVPRPYRGHIARPVSGASQNGGNVPHEDEAVEAILGAFDAEEITAGEGAS